MTDRYDALVIGGGPAGSTAAVLLARAGWRVAIAERASFPRRKVCGEFVSAPSWPLLRALGIDVALAGPAVRRVGLYADEVVMHVPMPAERGAFGHALGRDVLDGMLLARASDAGADVLQPCAVRSITRAADGFDCDCDARWVHARIVIAAHGDWEPGPLPTQPRRQRHGAHDLLAFKAHFRHTGLEADTMPLLVFPGGYGGMVHADAGRVSLSCCIRRDRLAACRTDQSRAGDAVLAHLLASCRGVRETLGRATQDGVWLAAGPIRPGIRGGDAPGLFRVGNAMGEAHPIVAEGINMAIQSAWLLSTLLIRHGDAIRGARPQPALRAVRHAYPAAYRRAFAVRIHAGALFAALATHEPTRNVMAAAVRRVPALLAMGARWSGKATPASA